MLGVWILHISTISRLDFGSALDDVVFFSFMTETTTVPDGFKTTNDEYSSDQRVIIVKD